MSNDFASLQAGYVADFNRMQIVPGRGPEVEAAARKIIANEVRYTIVQKATTTPWFAIGLLHMRESDFDFATHLHNGDSLKKRTVHKPVGRPLSPEPPYPWETSAIDAIRYDGLDKIRDWTLAGIGWATEKFNGFGPRNHGRKSGYVWAATTIYDGGKYGSDDKWDPDMQDKQLGIMAVLDELMSLRPDIAAIVNGHAPARSEPQPITLDDAKASLPAVTVKREGALGLAGVALLGLGGLGLHPMVILAAFIFGAVALLLWRFISAQRRLEHLQDAAATPVAPRSVDPAPIEPATPSSDVKG